MVGGICFAVLLVAGMIGSGLSGDLPQHVRLIIAVICLLLAFMGFFRAFGARKTFHIDISGVGQIRLGQDIDLAASALRAQNEVRGQSSGEVVQLLADSTLWPHFMLLRLQSDAGRIISVPVLRDCMSEESFRALAVACHWIAAQNAGAENGAV